MFIVYAGRASFFCVISPCLSIHFFYEQRSALIDWVFLGIIHQLFWGSIPTFGYIHQSARLYSKAALCLDPLLFFCGDETHCLVCRLSLLSG